MPPALAVWLRLAADSLPRSLAPALDPWIGPAGDLPGSCLAALESPLGTAPGAAPLVDLSLRLLTAAEARALVRVVSDSPARRLAAAWAARDDLRRLLPALWLEFDAARLSPRRTLPEPLPIVRLAPADTALDAPVGSDLLGLLLGRSPRPAELRRVAQAFELLPAGVSVAYLFGLGPRGREGFRLEVEGDRPESLATYLQRLGGSRLARRVIETAPLLGDLERVHLAVDLHPEIGPRVGVGGSYRRPPWREKRWGRLLERLVAARLCRGQEARDLLAWPGVDSFWDPPASGWPRASGALAGRLVRALSHVKLTLTEDGPVAAKGYRLVDWVSTAGRSESTGSAAGAAVSARSFRR